MLSNFTTGTRKRSISVWSDTGFALSSLDLSEPFDSIEFRDCSLSDLSPFASLAGVRTIRLTNTRVSDVSPLAAVPGLERLFLYGSPVEMPANARPRTTSVASSSGPIELRGSYFLTYHRWATRQQVEACHPRMVEFLRLKRRYDPGEVFQSDWYRHYRQMFADHL